MKPEVNGASVYSLLVDLDCQTLLHDLPSGCLPLEPSFFSTGRGVFANFRVTAPVSIFGSNQESGLKIGGLRECPLGCLSSNPSVGARYDAASVSGTCPCE